ncbi:hypothetical protein KP509_35G012600 [Ceratopteris richardii]|nr:hypothetical protein KP509_35G012600 [Ceratopteris richardii]
MGETWEDGDDSQNDSDDSIRAEPESLPKVRPYPVFTRMKTRLQDPPSLSPAIKSQLTYCRSTSTHQNIITQCAEGETSEVDKDPCVGDPQGTDPALLNQTNNQLGHLPSNSKLKVGANDEEEKNVLDDDGYIAEKKAKENKGLLITQWCTLLFLITLLVCTNKIQKLEKVKIFGLNLWRWQALLLVIFCGHLISGWIMKLFVSLTEKHYLLKKKVLYFVYGLRHSVKSCIWLALILAVWEVIFQGHEHTLAVNIMTRILWCLFTASMTWMIKVLAVKIAANSFHRKAYFDRIQDCLFNQYVLEKLSGPPCTHFAERLHGDRSKLSKRKHRNVAHSFQANNEREPIAAVRTRSDNYQPQEPISNVQSPTRSRFSSIWQKGHKKLSSLRSRQAHATQIQQEKKNLNGETDDPKSVDNISGETSQHKYINIGILTPKANTSVQMTEQSAPASSIQATTRNSDTVEQEKLQSLTSETVSIWTLKRLMRTIRSTDLKAYSSILSPEKADTTIDSEVQAKIAAKQVFNNMAKHGKKKITLQNFMYFLPEEHLARAFAMFETTENGEITKDSFIKWVVNVYTERRALCLTLNDNKTVVEKLHRLLNVVLIMILIPVFVLIFGVETPKILVFFTSIILPSVFMFGNSAKNLFESLIFLFVIHPFDVGDRIVVDGQTMLVEEMNILNTILLSPINEKVYYPNFLLCTKPISNYHRSPDMGDSIEFQIHMLTPLEKITELKDRIQKHIEGLPQYFYPEFRVLCKDIEDSTKMKMAIYFRHHLNYQEGGERFLRRSNLLIFLRQQLEDLQIGYRLPKQEIIVTGIPLECIPERNI